MPNGIRTVFLIFFNTFLPALIAYQPVETVRLHPQEVGDRDRFADRSKINAISCFTELNIMLIGMGKRSRSTLFLLRSQGYSFVYCISDYLFANAGDEPLYTSSRA